MAFSFRKSKKVGLFRFNFSSSGLGVSAGVKGARIGVGPKGTYVSLSKSGFQYRKKINGTKRKKSPAVVPKSASYNSNPVHQISTGNLADISDVDSLDFVQELEKKYRRINLHRWLGLYPLLILASLFLLSYLPTALDATTTTETITSDYFTISTSAANIRVAGNMNSDILYVAKRGESFQLIEKGERWSTVRYQPDRIGSVNNSVGHTTQKSKDIESTIHQESSPVPSTIKLCLILLFIPWTIFLYFFDRKRKTIFLNYSMDEEFEFLYHKFLDHFDEIFEIDCIWHLTSTQSSTNRKYTSGANNLVQRKRIQKIESNSLPTPMIKTNIQIPHIALSNIGLYFLPERLLLKRGNSFAAVYYKNLGINISSQRFIETATVPDDADIIDYTWKYTNKDGGQDLRFNGNYQLPICSYSDYHLSCENGIDEVITTSKKGGFDNFMNFLNVIGEFQIQYDQDRFDNSLLV